MTLTQIEIFVELAREKNFSRVAQKLGITQPAVSHAISKLEKELGTSLIVRENKDFNLTQIGHNILIYCKEIIKQTANVRSEVLSQQKGCRDKLILGTVWSVNNTLLPKIINSFKRQYPEIEVSVFEGVDQEIEEWLLEETIDIGVLGWSSDQLKQQKLAEDRYVAVVPKKHPLAEKKIVQVSELRTYDLISSKTGCGPLIKNIAKYHKVDLKLKYEAREVLTILNMVREGLGVSIFPELAIPIGFVGVKFIPLNTPITRNIFSAYKEENKSKPSIRLFLNHVANI